MRPPQRTVLPRPTPVLRALAPSAVLAALLGLLALGCVREQAPPLRIGINAWPGYEFLYLAQEKGFYADEGVEVRIVEFNSLADARRAYERGQVDGLGTTVVEVLQARDQSSRTPQILQVIDASEGADVILARPGVTNIAGLRGRKVGVELASLGIYILCRGIEKHGLSLNDITPVSMDQISMNDAFRQGELDGIVTYPPISVALLRDAKGHVIFDTTEIPGEVLDVIAMDEAIVRSRPDDISRFLRAYHRAMAHTREHPEESHRIMAKREGISPAEFANSLTNGIRLFGPSEQAGFLRPGGRLTEVLRKTDQVLRQSGQIRGPDRRDESVNPLFTGAPHAEP